MSLINTRTQDLREKSPELFQYVERASKYGGYDFFRQSTTAANSPVSDRLRSQAISSIGSTLAAPVYDKGSVSISSSRSVTIADSELTSQMKTFTFVTYSWGFTIVPGVFHNNEHDMQTDFNQKFLTYLHKFADTVDTACIAAMDTNKNQIYAETLGYTNAASVITADYAKREELIGDINPLMSLNDFYGNLHLVINPGTESIIRKMDEKGLYNEVNKKIQYSDKTLHISNRVTNAEGNRATMFAAPLGSVGLLYRMEYEALVDRVMKDGTVWSMDTLPLLDLPVSTYFYESKGDWNAINGAATAHLTRGYKQHYGWSVDVCYVTTYNQDLTTYANPIYKLAIASS